MNNLDVCAIVDGGNDIRCGVDEIRQVWNQGLRRLIYRYTVNGRTAMESSDYRRVFHYFMVGRSIDDIEVVSPRYRARRFRPNVFIPPELEVVEYEYEEVNRHDNHIVSELLPQYRITARQLLTD